MSDDSDDRFFDDLVNQVEMALETIDIDGFDARDSIVEGLRQALESAVDMDFENGTVPEVVVLEGGRDTTEETEGNERSRPELRVIERDEDAPEVLHDIRVKVIDPEPVMRRRRGTSALIEGTILVDRSMEGQTIYRGTVPATYRISKVEGSLEVALDGEWVETVHAGQSLDVYGQVIRVRTHDEDPVAASYLKL